MNDKFLRLLGLCRRANKIALGFDKSQESVKKGRAKAVFFASDISEKTKKEMNFIIKDKGIRSFEIPYDISTVSVAVGTPAGVVAVEDEGLKNALIKEL